MSTSSLNKVVLAAVFCSSLFLAEYSYGKEIFYNSCSFTLKTNLAKISVKEYQNFRKKLARDLATYGAESFREYVIVEDGDKIFILFSTCARTRDIKTGLEKFGKTSSLFSVASMSKATLHTVTKRFQLR